MENLITQIRNEISKDRTKASKLEQLTKDTKLEEINNNVLHYLLVEASDYNWQNMQIQAERILKEILIQGVTFYC